MNLSATLLKIADTAATRQISRRLASGDVQGARNLAQDLGERGGIKVTPEGSPVKYLGGGKEGIADVVVGAQDAPGQLAVRKSYDTMSPFYGTESMAAKNNMFKSMNRMPSGSGAMKTYSSNVRHGAGGTPYTVHEYVPGANAGANPKADPSDVYNDMRELRSNFNPRELTGGGATGMSPNRHGYVGDIHPGNVIESAENGKNTLVDFLPSSRQDTPVGKTPYEIPGSPLTRRDKLTFNVDKKFVRSGYGARGPSGDTASSAYGEGLEGSANARRIRRMKLLEPGASTQTDYRWREASTPPVTPETGAGAGAGAGAAEGAGEKLLSRTLGAIGKGVDVAGAAVGGWDIGKAMEPAITGISQGDSVKSHPWFAGVRPEWAALSATSGRYINKNVAPGATTWLGNHPRTSRALEVPAQATADTMNYASKVMGTPGEAVTQTFGGGLGMGQQRRNVEKGIANAYGNQTPADTERQGGGSMWQSLMKQRAAQNAPGPTKLVPPEPPANWETMK